MLTLCSGMEYKNSHLAQSHLQDSCSVYLDPIKILFGYKEDSDNLVNLYKKHWMDSKK